MKKQLLICLFIFFIFESCKKSSSESSQNNEVRGTLNAKDGTITSFVATGSQARFSRMSFSNGTYSISIIASGTKGVLSISLTNINSPGLYTTGTAAALFDEKSISGSFATGSYGNALEIFSTGFHPTPSLTITVDEVTANSIKGSFDMTCESTLGGIVQVTNGSFKGNF